MAGQSSFNPRPPRGGRLGHPDPDDVAHGFNPRPPRGGRCVKPTIDKSGAEFQSAPPVKGAIRLHWTTAVEFQERVDDLRSDIRAAREEAAAYFKHCKRTPILVLDDFGKNTWTPMVEKYLFSLIDHRKTHDLPILWSANTPPKLILKTGELSLDRGAPLIGRILEASNILNA